MHVQNASITLPKHKQHPQTHAEPYTKGSLFIRDQLRVLRLDSQLFLGHHTLQYYNCERREKGAKTALVLGQRGFGSQDPHEARVNLKRKSIYNFINVHGRRETFRSSSWVIFEVLKMYWDRKCCRMIFENNNSTLYFISPFNKIYFVEIEFDIKRFLVYTNQDQRLNYNCQISERLWHSKNPQIYFRNWT